MARTGADEDDVTEEPSHNLEADHADEYNSDLRRAEPTPAALLQALRAEIVQQRPRSPYSRHSRSHSAVAPPMARTRSLPIYEPRQRLPSYSPSQSPVRSLSPARAGWPSPRRSLDETRPPSATPSFMDIEIIAEDSELDIPPRPAPILDPTMRTSFSSLPANRSSGSRRRPASPLHSSLHSPTSHSPSPTPTQFNESYPSGTSYSFSSSSIPSTPTSLRSRSPSISSLETIPDSPDAEAEAIKAMERLRVATDGDESSDDERKSARFPRGRGSGTDKRKRWSVCGAERRGDFEMETIWEAEQ